MSNRKVVITNGSGEEVKTVEIKNNEVDITLDDSDGWVLANLGDDETESLEWRLVMAEHHNKRLSHENAALREQLHSLFERVSGCEVSELSSEQVNYLADMIEGQMDANEGCINKIKSENTALREAMRLKEAECEALASNLSRIVSAAADAHLSGSERQHVDHLYRVIRDASGKLYNKELGGGDEK